VTVSELRRDPVTGRWVVVSTERPRADDFDRSPVVIPPDDSCPFCGGHEHMTPFEVLAYRNGSPSNQPGWDLRVVPNQSPIVRVEGELDRQGEGLFDKMNGIGAHEVIIA
jgi:UDPglucose--hexose-1-phosphate uridylyltransferase